MALDMTTALTSICQGVGFGVGVLIVLLVFTIFSLIIGWLLTSK